MTQFDYVRALDSLMTPEVVSALGSIHEHKGKTSLLSSTHPDHFAALVEVAKIQSTSASNRIENISTSDKRLRELMLEKAEPRNRDEREIAGYRYVLDLIHESHDDIPITPGVILQLHRDLYRYSGDSHAGAWKDSDNVIAERTAQGELVARFVPTPAVMTPDAVEAICEEYRYQMDVGTYDPLLVSLVFAFDFVSIHPFNDGNGRMSRLLTLLLMYRSGYDVGKYVSIEKEIERTSRALCTHARRHDARRCRGHLQRSPRADRCPNARPPTRVSCVRIRFCEHPPVQRRQRAHEQAAHAAAHVPLRIRRGKVRLD